MPGHYRRLGLLLLLLAGPLRADEPAVSAPPVVPDTPAAASQTPIPAVKSDGPASGSTRKAPGAAEPARKAAQPGTATPQRFTPSERVRADYPVAFPIDI